MGKVLDNDLVRMLRNDVVDAFDSLYWKYHQAIYSNILKFTKDEEAAQDILQEVFTTLWEKRREIDEQQSVSGWLFVISFNKSINYTRKVLAEALAQSRMLAADETNDALIIENQYRLLQLATERLSPQKRKVFTLCKIEGKSYEQAAIELNISKHTVKEHLSLAIFSVKDFIRKHPEYWETATVLLIFNQFVGI